MKNIVKAFIVGQKEMLRSRQDKAIVGGMLTVTAISTIAGVAMKEPLLLSVGLSGATIDLSVAYMMGQRALKQQSHLTPR